MVGRWSWLRVGAWVAVLAISDLPEVVWSGLARHPPPDLFWAKVAVLAVTAGVALVWRQLRRLLPFALVFLVFYLALAARDWLGAAALWKQGLGLPTPSFAVSYLEFHLRDLAVAAVVIVALWVLKRRRAEFFLRIGELDAAIEPVRWLGIGSGESWRVFGWIFAAAAGLVTLIVVTLSIKPAPEALLNTMPFLPVVLLLAAVNAFCEEIYFRATLLSTLPAVVGKEQALLLNAVFFGLQHYLHGSPPGVIGFLMTGFLGWLMGKAMLETRGLFWPWLIHFVPDVFIFASYALTW